MDIIKCIEALSDLPGVSGGEDAVRDEILARIGNRCDCRVDPLGNIIAFKKGKATPKNKLMLSAHMDEVGLIITFIDDSGLLRFTTVGGIDSRVIFGKAVEVGSKRIYGVIGAKPVHMMDEKERSLPISPEKLYIDIGANSREEAETLVTPGDRAVFHSKFLKIGDGNILGRAFDDRAGCALLLALIETDLPYDCHFAFTVQEETGCTGAVTAAYTVDPDIGIAVETTTASDIPGVEPDKVVCSFGKGPVLSFMDRGTIYDSGLYHFATNLAKDKGIPCQAKEGVFGGNESRSVQTSRGGARMLAVSLPCRYLHTPSNMLCEQDIHSTLALLKHLASTLPAL